jgi:hypothetical protein
VSTTAWPSLPVADWADTRDTLQLCTQIVGKIRLAHPPLLNHCWNVALSVAEERARARTARLGPDRIARRGHGRTAG